MNSAMERIVTTLQLIMEALMVLVQVLIHLVIAVVMAVVPTTWIAKDIKGQTVLITGAASGIGSLLAVNFAKQGCNLVLWDVNEEMNEATAKRVRTLGVSVSTNTVDLSKRSDVYEAAKKVESDVGPIDILVNNAGVVFGRKILDSVDDQMIKTMEVNCLSHYWTCKAFLPSMVKRNSGHIVTVASSAGIFGVPGMADYCSSKFGAIGYEESLRLELGSMAKDGIKTTLVCPFLIDTGMFDGCKSRFPLILDALKPQYVADKIVDGVLRNQEILYIPRLIYVTACLKAILPVKCQNLIYDFFGGSTMMNTFAGSHSKKI